ncbi:DUF5667 domain-containing protein [Streptomyces sp. NPDC050504]|uniref:DUF5667 domain-containing protein n=1 Tax=Streptomyces sp. NPDC050504 TaxID=3365618 RepID=UPI0037B311F3
MIANVSAHRRANAFAQALEDQTVSDLPATAATQPEDPAEPAGSTESGRLLALANGLGELPRPEMDPEVKVVQRAQLVAAMEAMFAAGGAGGPTVPEQRTRRGAHRLRKLRPRSRWSKGLAAGGLTVGVAAGAFGGVAAASSDALPGDSLYGLKRGMEDLRLGLTDGNTDRGELYLDQASTRLSEARRLMERAKSGHMDHESLGEVRRALNGMKHDAAEGHRLLREAYERDGSMGPIQSLSSFSKSHRDTWAGIRDRLPVQLADVSSDVTSVFDAIDEEVEPLRQLLPSTPKSERTDSTSDSTGTSDGKHRGTPAPPKSPAERQQHPSTTEPQPSGSGSRSGKSAEDGLLGGNTGGLLDDTPSSEPTAPSPSAKNTPAPAPDVTIPPLLPEILPDLGISTEDR